MMNNTYNYLNITDFYDAVAHEYSDQNLHATTALLKRTEEMEAMQES